MHAGQYQTFDNLHTINIFAYNLLEFENMKIELPYGTDKIEFTIDDRHLLQIVEPNEVICKDTYLTIERAVEAPSNYPSLADFVKDSKNLLIIVNDATRPTPTAKILEVIYEIINKVPHKFIVATGMHRPPTKEEYYQIFGNLYDEIKDKVFAHDSKDHSQLAYLGKTKFGTDIYINKMALEADKIVVIGSVEPHYFAGYTGGRKGFLPGISGFTTIEQNHKYALDIHAQPLALQANPVHEDMEDTVRIISDFSNSNSTFDIKKKTISKTDSKPIFSIMTVLDKNHNIYAVTAGDIFSSFYDAVKYANEVFSVKIKEKADIVISVAPYPMDIDLYQSQKALDNGKLALKENGILILVSKCRMGIGEEGFVKLLSQSKNPKEVFEKIKCEYRLGHHKAAKIAEIALWAKIFAVTDLKDEVLKSVFMIPYKSIQQAVDNAIKDKGNDAKLLILLNGSITVPRIEK